MQIEKIKNPTKTQYDWADLTMRKLERNQMEDTFVNVIQGFGTGEETLEKFSLSEICQAIIFNYNFEEYSQRQGFPNV